ncbi:hypothetical protein AB0M95_01795 [Sphaerisporangium sp. NPDC051017]|uniref:hypothetical protein n=2 Tax=unclassified Sphaerisporangium TaxID=2630420 RepID=UPI00343A17B4
MIGHSLAAGRAATYLLDMARIVLSVLGVVLALYVVFGLLIPTIFGIFKILLVVGLIGLAVFAAITLVSKLSK